MMNDVRITKICVTTQRLGARKRRPAKNMKTGLIIHVFPDGREEEVVRETATTFKSLSKKLRSTGLIPTHVTIKKYGTTIFK